MHTVDTKAHIVILTGAGISRESGLDTFRDSDGIWSKVRLEDVATPEAFQRDPVRVHDFYNARRRALIAADVQPNPAHRALADLERAWPGGVLLVTQNIDDLHERGGSKAPLHMHGELLKSRCQACGDTAPCVTDLSLDMVCPACATPGQLRPHVVWFGEMPLQMERIEDALARAGICRDRPSIWAGAHGRAQSGTLGRGDGVRGSGVWAGRPYRAGLRGAITGLS